jgi:CubicO group peptidase (beta-lactamase class C family)
VICIVNVAEPTWREDIRHDAGVEDTSLRQVVERAVASAPTPAAAVSVTNAKHTLASAVAGTANTVTGEAATAEHWWDLASLTKTLVTLPEVMSLVAGGQLDLRAPLGDQWPRVRNRPVAQLTLAELLSFRGGLPASPRHYLQGGFPTQILERFLDTTPENRAPNVALYSDVSFILAGAMVTDLAGESLDSLAARRAGLCFGHVPGPVVATEICHWRDRLLIGEVHDENASALGGVAGHAGAFGTQRQVTDAARWWLTQVLTATPAGKATREWSRGGDGERFGLGWWLPPTRGLGGVHPGPNSFGASGFVGNRVWVEPSRGYAIVVLTNRVHPHREDREPFDLWCSGVVDAVAAVANENPTSWGSSMG